MKALKKAAGGLGLAMLLAAAALPGGCTMVQYPALGPSVGEGMGAGAKVERAAVPSEASEVLNRRADAEKIRGLAARGDGWRWIDGREGTQANESGPPQTVVQTYFSRVSVERVEEGKRGVVEEVIPAHRRANRPRFPNWRGPLPDDATLLYTGVSATLAERFGTGGTFDPGSAPAADPSVFLNMPTQTLVLWAYGPRENAKGVVVWLHSAGGTAYEATICKRLVKLGWWVLESEFPWPLRRSQAFLMFSEGPEAIRNTAQDVAREVDERMMIVSDAVNTSLALLEKSRGLKGLPRVVVGASLGGFTAPAACAGLDRPPEATVFIDTGSDMIDLFEHSPLPNARVTFGVLNFRSTGPDVKDLKVSGRGLTADERALLTKDFDEASALCPVKLAPALASRPSLLVTATQDEVVRRPSRLALWKMLGEPERWELDVGHEMMVYLLPNWGDQIAAWIDAHGSGVPGGRPR
ncbi:MAG: hypothetical protein GC200_06870 [Tepidisphaera sp.]|nr:hypothetical protein [Tepidisphaera sp.]